MEAQVDLTGEGKGKPGFPLAAQERLRTWLPLVGKRVEEIFGPQPAAHSFNEEELAGLWTCTALELQNLAGSSAHFGRVEAADAPGQYRLFMGCEEEPLGRACFEAARELLSAALGEHPVEMPEMLKRLGTTGNHVRLGPTTGSIVRAARAREIPVRRLDMGSLVQLGHGARQHRIRMAVTDVTSSIGESIAKDKDVTKNLLRSLSVPVPAGRVVSSAEDAWAAAQEIGLPVVVKPTDANHGRGVTINLTTCEQIKRAYGVALPEGDGVIVEQFAVGTEHRLLVVAGKMIAAAKAEPEWVTGDGVHTVSQLVDELNADPRRGDDWASQLCRIEIDSAALLTLENQGVTPDSVPPAGAPVVIHYNGEHVADVTDLVHPEVAAHAVLAARIVGLDIAGVDVIARSIDRPLREQGGMIVEVNAGPGLRMHLDPPNGKPRPVAEAIVSTLFAEEDGGRIPIVAILDAPGKVSAVSQLVTLGLKGKFASVGVATAQELSVGSDLMETGPGNESRRATGVLLHPDTEAAVCETPAPSIVRDGLAFDRCSVAVVTGAAPCLKPNGKSDIDPHGLAPRVLIETVAPRTGFAVLDADLPGAKELAGFCPGEVIHFTKSPDGPVPTAHRKRGGRVLFFRGQEVILAQGKSEVILGVWDEPKKPSGKPERAEDVLAATGALWAVLGSAEALRPWFAALKSAGS